MESRIYEIRPRKDDEGLSLRCEAISMRLWFMTQNDATSYTRHRAQDGGGFIRVITRSAICDLRRLSVPFRFAKEELTASRPTTS
jgi:hypothetical protein